MKVRKTLEAWPLRLRLGAEYDLRANEVTATAECRDTILGGEFTLDVLHRAVEYRKQFDLGGVSQVALKGRCDLSNLGASGADRRDRLDVSFGFVIEPKVTEVSGVSAHFSSTTRGYDVITEIPLSKLVSAEVCGHLTLPVPRAEFSANSGGGGRLTVGRGNVKAHVAQINAVINL